MKIFVNSAGENWICDRARSEFYNFNPEIATDAIQAAGLVWVIAPWMFKNHNALANKKSIFSIYHITPSKFNKNKLKAIDNVASAFHTICEKTKDFMKDHVTKPIFVEPFWVNQNVWFPLDKNKCTEDLNLPADRFIIGSFQRDTEGGDLKTPKLEKGPDQFCDIVESMFKTNNKIHVLLGGWRRQYVISRMKKSGIPYTYIERPPISIVNKMYNCLDLYIVGSRYEGGPQSIPECAATRTPIISTNVGCSDIYLNPNSVFEFPNYKNATPDCDYGFEKAKKNFIPKGFDPYKKMFKDILSLDS